MSKKQPCYSRAAWLPLLFMSTLVWTLLGASGSTCAGTDTSNKASTHTINIEMMQFSPKTIEVHVGDTVIWKNNDMVAHTATADNKEFSSGEIPANRSWKFVPRKKGTFPYACSLHPTMKATLVVK